MKKGTVAIIGAGVSGLAAARYLKSQGFSPTIFEAHDDLGGQWNRHNARSAVWPEMRTNTARFVTRFSDLQYPAGTSMFPRNGEVLDHLNRFAAMHGLNEAATQHSAHEYWPCVTRLFGNCRSVCVCFPEYCMSSWGYGCTD